MTGDDEVEGTTGSETGGLRPGITSGLPDLENLARQRGKEIAAVSGLILVAAVVAASLFLGGPGEKSSDQEELTQYQKQYVDCPPEYLETCTRMSKLPTEPITYWKTENGKLYLKLEDGRAIIATLPGDSAPGEFVTYMSAAEVREATGKTSQESAGNSTS